MTHRTVMQQALEALQNCYNITDYPGYGDNEQSRAIDALKAALETPEQEHVGYLLLCKDQDLCLSRIRTWVTEFGLPDDEYKLYAQPISEISTTRNEVLEQAAKICDEQGSLTSRVSAMLIRNLKTGSM